MRDYWPWSSSYQSHAAQQMHHILHLSPFTFVVLLYCLEDRVYPFDVHISWIYEVFQFYEFIPNLLLEDSFRGDGESLWGDKIGLFLITEIGVSFKELLKSIPLGFEFAIIILEHADGSSCVDDENLAQYDDMIPCDYLGPRMIGSRYWLLLESASEIRICRGCRCCLFVNNVEP